MSINVEAFFDAINQISQANINSTKKDLTINAEVTLVVNVDIGEYKVTYQGNVFSAFSTDPLVVYKKGEQVYVLVPQGDFSGKKIILGRSAYQNNLSYADQQAMTNIYIDKGPNWLDAWYTIDHTPLQICAVPASSKGVLAFEEKQANYSDVGFMRAMPNAWDREEATRYPTGYMTPEELAEADEQLSAFADVYSWLKIGASFRTQFTNSHTVGKYSLIVELLVQNPTYNDNKNSVKYNVDVPKYLAVPYELGFKDFNGTPYSFIVESPQVGYFQVEPGTIKGLSRIYLTQDGNFVADIRPQYNAKGQIEYKIENSIYDENNIFCDDIEIRFAEKVNLTEGLFYCYIESPFGNNVYDANPAKNRPNGRGSVDLIAHLIYGYEEVLNKDNCRVYWFRRKLDCTLDTPTEEDRDEWGMTWVDYAGPGWIPIKKLGLTTTQYRDTDGDGVLEPFEVRAYDVDFDKLTVYKEAVPWEYEYKAVVVYTGATSGTAISGSNILSATETVHYLDTEYNLALEQFTSEDKNTTYLRIDNLNKSVHDKNPETGENYREWFGTWWIERADGSYYQISEPYHEGPFAINKYLLNQIQTFYVQCYDPDQVDPGNAGQLIQVPEVGNLFKVVITADEGDLSVDWVGRDHYNYDANGTLKDAAWDVDQTLEPELHWLDGKLVDYNIMFYYGKDCKEEIPSKAEKDSTITGTGTLKGIESSMLHQVWWDTERNVIHYKVREKYDETKTDNTFMMVLTTTSTKKTFKIKKTITFTKDGDQGTQGSDWAAPIWPCNYLHAPKDTEEGPYVEKMDYLSPLVLIQDPNTGAWTQRDDDVDNDFCHRVFLRPFVTKNGRLIENIDPHEGYFYRVYWDVREAYNHANPLVKRSSWLRLYHAADPMVPASQDVVRVSVKQGNIYKRMMEGNAYDEQTRLYEAGNAVMLDSDVNENEKTPDGLQGYSVYPSHQFFPNAVENYGAVEVRFFDNLNNGTGASLEECLYRFIVKAQIEIYRGQYDHATQTITTANAQRLATINSFYPVDIFFDADNKGIRVGDIATNWPRYCAYDATGYNPTTPNEALFFKYGPLLQNEKTNWRPENWTPLTQTLEERQLENAPVEYWYRPKPHLNSTEGFHGVLATQPGLGPFGNGWYLRNQIMYLNNYGNVDINAWDGQGIDMNEENGTIFAPTIGAGYKNPYTNTFTGVLMGIDKSQKKGDVGGMIGNYDQDAMDSAPYIAGIYGYQNGESSFGIMENGTAFFGKASGGGRIIIDGTNATIYGGANGILNSPSIGDNMWNSMRLTLVDLTHATSGKGTSQDYDFDGFYSILQYPYEYVTDVDGNRVPIPIYDVNPATLTEAEKKAHEIQGATIIDTNNRALTMETVLKYKVDNGIDNDLTYLSDGTIVTYWSADGIEYNVLMPKTEAVFTGVKSVNGTYITQGFNGKYYEAPAIGDNGAALGQSRNAMPWWYRYIWQNAYIQPGIAGNLRASYEKDLPGALPWYTDIKNDYLRLAHYATLPSYYYPNKSIKNAIDAGVGIRADEQILKADEENDGMATSDKRHHYRINYFDPENGHIIDRYPGFDEEKFKEQIKHLSDKTGWNVENLIEFRDDAIVLDKYHKSREIESAASGTTVNLSGFGASRASTTPAIEVGQHIRGLHPGLLPWDSYNYVMEHLNIPGDRNFMVTYDGTLWAMNGVFMGLVLGSNIVGGRIQGAELGIGDKIEDDLDIWVHITPWQWENTLSEYAREILSKNYPGVFPSTDCDWPYLIAPVETKVKLSEIRPNLSTAFQADDDGVVASDIKIYGGSIDMGHFHLTNEGDMHQFGHSNFIGPTHIYGSLGIGPGLNVDQPEYAEDIKNAQLGNIFQTKGKIGLGITLPNKTSVRYHKAVNINEIMEGATYSVAGAVEGAQGLYAPAGVIRPGNGDTIENLSFFGLDTTTKDFPKQNEKDKTKVLQGHFWPMHFHLGYCTGDAKVGDESISGVLTSYMTVMDQFMNNSITIQTGKDSAGKHPLNQSSSNYFRVGPFGAEGQLWFIRKSFQSQTSQTPITDEYYVGRFGLVDRAGDTNNQNTDQYAIGITSWDTAPILFKSDGEGAFDVRGHLRITARGRGGNATQGGETWTGGVGYGCHIKMGSIFDDGNGAEPPYSANMLYAGTCMGPMSFGVQYDTKGNKCALEYVRTTPVNGKMGLELIPDGDGGGANARVSLWGKNAPVHIWSGEKDASNSEGHPMDTNCAIWLNGRPESGSTRIVGRKAISILLKKSPHEQIKPQDQGFGVDEGQLTISHKKNLHISGTSNYNTDYMLFTNSKVDMMGIYQVPDNQHHIYARFG